MVRSGYLKWIWPALLIATRKPSPPHILVIRKRIVNAEGWLFFPTCSICLAVSALYKLLGWGVAVTTGSGTAADLPDPF